MPKGAMDPDKWQGLLDQLDASSAGGDVYYLKEQRTRVHLVLAPDQDEEAFYAETEKHFKGKVSTAYLVHGIVLQTSKAQDENANAERVRAIRIPKSVLRGIVSQLAEGWELFDPNTGSALTIEKSSVGDRTNYMVKVSKQAVKVSPTEWPSKPLEEIAAEEAARAAERDGKRQDGGRGNQPSRNQPREVDYDEEDLPF